MKKNKTNHKQIITKMACIFTCLLILINTNPINTYAEDTTEYDYESALIILSIMNANGIYINTDTIKKEEFYTWWDVFCIMSQAGVVQMGNDISIKNLIRTTIEVPTATWVYYGLQEDINLKAKKIVNVINWLASKINDFCKEKNYGNDIFNVKIYKYQMYQDKTGYNYFVEFIGWLAKEESLIEFGSNVISVGVTYTNTAYSIHGYKSNEKYTTLTIKDPKNILFNYKLNKFYVYEWPEELQSIDELYIKIEPQNENIENYIITYNKDQITDTSLSFYESIYAQENKNTMWDIGYYSTGNGTFTKKYYPETYLRIYSRDGDKKTYGGITGYAITKVGTYDIQGSFSIEGQQIEEKGDTFEIGNILGLQLDLITDNQFLIMDYLNIIAEEGLYSYETLLDIDKTLMEILYAQSTGQTYNFNNEQGGIQYNYVNCNIYDNSTNQTTNLTNNYIQNTNTKINNSYEYMQNIEQNIMNYINNNFDSIDIKGDEFKPSNEITNGLSLIKSTIEQTYTTMKDNNLSMPLYLSMILSFILMVIK